jgi:hypothetical protein
MATILSGNDTNRLAEVLAGSTALLSNPTGADSGPLALSSLLGDTTSDVIPNAAATDHTASQFSAVPLDSLTALPDSITDTVADTTGLDAGNLLGVGDVLHLGTDSQLDLAGPDGGIQPVFDATNILVKDVHVQLETLVDEVGLQTLGHSITNLGETAGLGTTGVVPPAADGHTNLVTDVVNLPATLVDQGLDHVIAQVGGDLGDTLHAATGVVDSLLNGSDALNPVPELIDSLGADLQNIPLLTINGGTSAGDGGLLGGGALGGGLLSGALGDTNGSSSGHLIDVDAGPQTTGGLGLDLLAAPGTDATHTASVNAIDVGPNGPHLLDLGVVTGAGIISVPTLDGAGSDGLVGNLLGGGGVSNGLLNGDIASGNTTAAPVAPVDLTAAHDLTAPLTGDHGVLDLHAAHII